MIVAGMDIGSITTETVLLRDGEIFTSVILPTGANSRMAAERSLSAALEKAGVIQEELAAIVTTGYGRASFAGATKMITEITCHARGAFFVHPRTRTVIDIGGQDTKAISVAENNEVRRFLMNDKCAAGTGRFLEVMARTLEIDLEDFGDKALEGRSDIIISSMCTVFAESEVVSLIADGVPIEDIARGVCRAIASRTVGLLDRIGREKRIAMSGGVAKNQGVVRALESNLNLPLAIPSEPQAVGALGAALIAREVR